MKKKSTMTPKEAFDYYFKKEPHLLIVIIILMIIVFFLLLNWDGSIPVSSGLTTFFR
jgi:hypothetical protein